MPLIWVVTTSVRPLSEMTQTPPLVFPRSLTFHAYVDMWDTGPFVKYFANSMVISLSTALIALAFSVCAAYSFARFRFRGNTLLLMVVVMSQMLPRLFDPHPALSGDSLARLARYARGHGADLHRLCHPVLHLAAQRLFPRHPHRSRASRAHRRLQPPPATLPELSCRWPHRRSWPWEPLPFCCRGMNFCSRLCLPSRRPLTIPVGLRAAFLGQYVNKYDQLFAASLIFSLPPHRALRGIAAVFCPRIDGWCRKGITHDAFF